MVEVTGKHPQADICVTHLEELQNGPSGMKDHYEAVNLGSEGGGFYDDGLSTAELDIISGVVRIYTGMTLDNNDVELLNLLCSRPRIPNRGCIMVA